MEKNISISNRLSNAPNHKATLEIVTSFELWDFLLDGRTMANQSKGNRHRYSKAEAFFDLLDRQRISNSTGDNDYMNNSVQLLANTWGWMRPTAKKFLDKLQEIGAITLTSSGNRIVVSLNNIIGEDISASQNGSKFENRSDGCRRRTLTVLASVRRRPKDLPPLE